MKPSIPALIVLALAATGCGDDQAPDEAAALYDRILNEDYRSFQTAPGYDSPQESSAPHSDRTQIFVNGTVAAVLDAGEPITSWPVGSLIVKDGFDSDDEHALIAVMDKRDDGWFWAEYLDPASSESKYSGKPDLCTGCHEAGDDFVQGFAFPGGS